MTFFLVSVCLGVGVSVCGRGVTDRRVMCMCVGMCVCVCGWGCVRAGVLCEAGSGGLQTDM